MTPVTGGIGRTVLPNGLRVVSETVPAVRSVSVGIWIGVGSRDEPAPVAGAAHFLEHLLFKGTARRSAARIAEEIDAVGGELNAFTAKEHTCYYAQVLDEDLPLAVDLLCDVVNEATLAAADVELERGVVLEELAMREDDPEDLLTEEFDAALFGDHPLGRPVIGTQTSVENLTRTRLRNFWRRRYTPDRMVVAAAGNLDHERLRSLVDKGFATRRGGGVVSPAGLRPGPGRCGMPGRSRRLGLRPDDGEQAHLMLGLPGLHRLDGRAPALAVLNAALGGGMSSRLFQQVREQRGLAYSVYSATSTFADAGLLTVYAGCAPERLGPVAGLVVGVLRALARDGLSDAELARSKGQLRGGLVLGLEDTESRMSRLGHFELGHGRQEGIGQSLTRIETVTGEAVARLAAELLSRPLTAAVVGPYAAPDELPEELREVIR